MSFAKIALLAGAVLGAASATQAQAPGLLDRLLGGPAAPAAPNEPPAAQPSPTTLPTLVPPPAAQAPQPAPVQPPAAQAAPGPLDRLLGSPAAPAAPNGPPAAQPSPTTLPTLVPPPAAQAPQPAPVQPPAAQAPAMAPMGGTQPAAGLNVQFQAPPPATAPLERPPTPSAAELDVMTRLQTDIARLRLELEKARLEREIAQQRQTAPTQTAATPTQAPQVRPAATRPPPPPAAIPQPELAVTDRRALPQVIEIRGAAGNFVAVVQSLGGQRFTLRAGDALPNTPLKVQSIEPRTVNFVSQEGNRGPYPVPVSPVVAAPTTPANPTNIPVVQPLSDTGLAIPIAR